MKIDISEAISELKIGFFVSDAKSAPFRTVIPEYIAQ
jgi:hypothetical protein